MSQWTTVSVETPDGDHFYRTESRSWGQSQMDQPLPQEVDGSKLAKVCIIACNDTSGAATIAYSEWDEVKDTIPHEGSLWTVSSPDRLGAPREPANDIYAELPEWCLVRGNWRRRIDR
jgi:hypothetical protein